MIHPLTIGMGAAVLGFIALRTRKCARAGTWAAGGGLFVLLLFGYPFVPGALLKPLEGRYRPLTPEGIRRAGNPAWIAVLCGGRSTHEALPANSRLNLDSLSRFIEGVRLHRLLPGSTLLISIGHLVEEPADQERLIGELAAIAGIPPHGVRPVAGAKSTQEEARSVYEIVGTQPVLLVTSDYHMPRAMLLFRSLGMNPVAAPAGACGMADEVTRFSPACLFPNAGNLVKAHCALHEYLAILWAKVTGTRR